MGTDIHKVPLTWTHPRDEDGQYVELKNRRPPLPRHNQLAGFMFYSSISDTPYSDQIFTDRRAMMLWWIYAGRALEAQDQNWNAINAADLIEKKIGFFFDREGVPPAEIAPITQDEMPRCLVLDGEQRKLYAKARKMYRDLCDDPGCHSDTLEAVFTMFDEWLKD